MQLVGGALISAGVLEQIKLVVLLGVPPLRSGGNFCDNFLAFRGEILFLNFLCYTLRNGLLFLSVEIYC